MIPWVRVLLTHAEDYLETLSEQAREEGLDLIAAGKFKIRNEIRTDGRWEETGIRYVVDLLPDDGRVLTVANVHQRYVSKYVDEALLAGLDEAPPDDPSSLS
jgi:hypothetical protein